ncbi:MAG: lysophospholipid acyltransferase family protein [Candidatus Omnitrophota bacterium]
MNKENILLYLSVRFILHGFYKICFFFKATGRKFVPKSGGCIIASNHLSYLDPMVLSIASPRILNFLAKRDLFKGFFGVMISALNAFPVERGKGDLKAIRTSLGKLKDGKALIVFPEGTRSTNGQIKDAESGVGMLAAKSGVAVVPTYIIGTDLALPAKEKKFSLFIPISVHFAAPLSFDGLGLDPKNKNDYQIFADKVIESIRELKSKNCL